MKRTALIAILMLLLAALACQAGGETGPSAEEMAETMVAETAAAASPTPLPPTETPIPTATATATLPPTETPTITPTPGPVFFTDDFSGDSKANWDCPDGCKFQENELYMGPYKVQGEGYEQSHTAVCIPCGTATYYRIAVDATFYDGYTDRFYGLLVGQGEKFLTFLGISPLQVAVLARQDKSIDQWKILNASGEKVFNRLVAPGVQTNRLEIEIKPAASGTADIYMKLNGQVSFVAYKVSVEPSEVGLYIDWHSVGAIFDNFEFEEIEP